MRSQQNVHHVGLYCRLSRDDGNDGPSMSIEKQKQLLLDYVAERGWKVYDVYVDDGLTGTNLADVRQRYFLSVYCFPCEDMRHFQSALHH